MPPSSDRPVVVLVDAYTSAKYLPPEFGALGADLVHVQSTPELMPSMPAPDLSVYRATIVHEDVEGTLARLRPYAPVCVAAGQEPGVPLADVLSERLGLTTNGTALSQARRDKYRMIEVLREAGLHCADQFKAGDVEALVAWAERAADYPVVVKPLRSAAGDGVFVCRDAEEVRDAAKAVLASETIYCEANREALVQSYLRGVEYVVDTVSYAGRRYVCGVWEYQKRLLPSGRNIYDRERLLAADEHPAPELIDYVDRALAALGVDFGPAHAEVMWTPGGAALVEVGARIGGNMHPGFHDRCAGANQATVTALAYLDPGRFMREYAGRRYAKRLEAVCCTTSTTLSGVVEAVDHAVADEIAALETVFGLDLKIAPGERIRPTVDLYSSTLRIFMCGRDMDAVNRDYARIEELKDRVYRIRDDECR
ncbi:ATP-grasp domain-containing protein [Microbispora sp. NPDC088329]|uniref:ATP-grasp domain-containing protein n=1 Tax=Microbispora sp. NPDC088329 TaxID=3154869 RepID=UPI00344479D7